MRNRNIRELVFGKTVFVSELLEGESNTTYVEYLISLFNRSKYAQMTTRENLILAKTKSKDYYD
jgi:hypothetical protein